MNGMVSGGRRGGPGRAGRRGLIAAVAVLALVLLAGALAPRPTSRAATGAQQDHSPVFVGSLVSSNAYCTATLVRPWMAITAKHCGTSGLELRLGVTSSHDTEVTNVYKIKKIVPHPSLDVEALYLKDPARWDDRLSWGDGHEYDPTSGDPLEAWGFGLDVDNVNSGRLTMATFPTTKPCPQGMAASRGDFCFPATSTNSLCSGDSGGPVVQGFNIVAMGTAVRRSEPRRAFSCGDVTYVQAIAIPKISGWLHDRSCEAAPPDTWPCG